MVAQPTPWLNVPFDYCFSTANCHLYRYAITLKIAHNVPTIIYFGWTNLPTCKDNISHWERFEAKIGTTYPHLPYRCCFLCISKSEGSVSENCLSHISIASSYMEERKQAATQLDTNSMFSLLILKVLPWSGCWVWIFYFLLSGLREIELIMWHIYTVKKEILVYNH